MDISEPYYSGERKSWGLRSAYKPQEHDAVAGYVHVHCDEGIGMTPISFSEAFVTAIGKAMPQGVSRIFPVWVWAVQQDGDKWEIKAKYLDEKEKTVVLWVAQGRPEWLKRVKWQL